MGDAQKALSALAEADRALARALLDVAAARRDRRDLLKAVMTTEQIRDVVGGVSNQDICGMIRAGVLRGRSIGGRWYSHIDWVGECFEDVR